MVFTVGSDVRSRPLLARPGGQAYRESMRSPFTLRARVEILTIILVISPAALANIRPETVRTADIQKTQSYLKDGLIVGGDRAIDQVIIKDIRRAMNPDYERLVIDLEGSINGEPAAIQRAPFYQIAVNAEEKRLILTVWGKPKLAFDSAKVMKAFKKSRLFSSVELYPKLEEESWTFALHLASDRAVEVFELKEPVRIIVDVRAGGAGGRARKQQRRH